MLSLLCGDFLIVTSSSQQRGGPQSAVCCPKGVHVTMPRRLIANLSLEGVLTFLKTAHCPAEPRKLPHGCPLHPGPFEDVFGFYCRTALGHFHHSHSHSRSRFFRGSVGLAFGPRFAPLIQCLFSRPFWLYK